jgi:purine-binding chemotaxis protein CheW
VISDHISGAGRVRQLRRAFDLSFAEAPPTTETASENLLNIRCGLMPCAFRVSDISGVFADVKITRVPTPLPELLGIAAFRGSLLPVYDLHALLGYAVDTRPRWLAVAAATPLGLAFDVLEGQRHVPSDAIVGQRNDDAKLRHVSGIAQLDGVARPIISVSSLLEQIRTRLRAGTSDKE